MSVTGRDTYITALALCHAIRAIESLPPIYQAQSDLEDMYALFASLVPDERARAMFEQEAARHVPAGKGAA
jgi:hypothetical protein